MYNIHAYDSITKLLVSNKIFLFCLETARPIIMCQEFPGSPPAIINKDTDDSTGDLQSASLENSLTYRRRVLLLGRSGSGKSSLAKSLVSGSSQTSDGPTDSLDIQVWCPFQGTTNGQFKINIIQFL